MSHNKYKAPFFPYVDIQNQVEKFLDQFNENRDLPVPIEEIAEFKLQLEVIPVQGLLSDFDIDGFCSLDLSRIWVDQQTMQRSSNRYRFTIAHEVGHLVLHRDLFSKFQINSIEEWMDFISGFDEREYGWFEQHAYNFAGLVLVPANELKLGFDEGIGKLRQQGTNPNDLESSMLIQYVSHYLSRKFEVSEEVVARRLKKEKYLTDSA